MRRSLPRRIGCGCVLGGSGLALALLVWGVLVEPGRLVLHEATLPIPHWSDSLSGLRVVALSDLHVGVLHVDLEKLDEIVDTVNELSPDVVVLLGDYVIRGVAFGSFVPPEAIAHKLGRLRARVGVLAVLGNHEWWFDGERVRRALERAGVPVLEDDAVRLERRGSPLWIAGLADVWTRSPDLEKALANVPAGEPVIVLTHNPDVFPTIPARVSLTLAGHTHGGQVRLPWIGSPIVPSSYGQRYVRGHVVEDGQHLFVTTGIGSSILPVRIGVPPEIAVLTLVME